MKHLPKDMVDCIDICTRCATTCLTTAMNHCLEVGGKHVERRHFSLMIACAETCRAAAAVMMTGVAEHREVCRSCAAICKACAESCAEVGDMDDCVAVCRECADSCRRMGGATARAA
ncbi:four-helix bundle copper-binding protein [Hyphomicrobium sp. CS1GBMeth3]|uniref:four-helix bundle copper-binding protein n=1 Tax=Hyphomicrobium sp. CS1GBMeth3 TaxID=1892845 RepID=UPI00093082CA|nr:four-helix bundle copper-binding protein [Hyphomicrobium sp. CS1GBMeth3]